VATIEQGAADLEARLIRAEPHGGSVAAEAMLGRVLEGVLEQPAQPLKAGRYVILDALGRGGLGEVHAAYDPELDRRVAIKLVRADVTAWDDLERRMLREAQAMAQIRHANVVAIHDVGRFRDQVFIAMELIDGVTLGDWLRQRPRTWTEIRDVFVQAGQGLAAVHAAGLVQRDFKPANVLVGHDGVVKVLDFGLARATAESADAAAPSDEPTAGRLLEEELTRAGIIAGTPAYMAPEQCHRTHTDAAADQFAFCVALYEALWGERPFPASDLALRLQAIEAGPNTNAPTARNVPPWARRAVLRGLAAAPADRHASMNDLLRELQRDKRRRARTWLAVGAAAVLSAVTTSVVFAVYEPPVSQQQLDEVRRLVDEAHAAADAHYFVYPPLDDPAQATAYSRTLALEHIEGPARRAARAQAAMLRKEFSMALTELADAYSPRAGGAAFAAEFYAGAVLFDPDNAHARERSLLTAAQLAALQTRVERQEFGTAELLAGASMAALAEPDATQRRRKVQRLQARRSGAPASTMASLDELVGNTAAVRHAAADPAPEPSGADARPEGPPPTDDDTTPPNRGDDGPGKTSGPADPSDSRAASALAKQGLAAIRAHQLDAAESLLHRAVAEDRNNPTALGGLATLYFELGRYADAVTYARRAVRAAPKRASHHMTLGDAYFKVLRYDDARKAYQEAQRLGAADAQRRLDRVDAKLGAK
jgi:tetratricopeptide (TPR) repeat protein